MATFLTVLGIESSCDDTAAAVVQRAADGTAGIRSSIAHGQKDLHRDYGGIVPEIAARAHAVRLDSVTQQALDTAKTSLDDIDLIAVTAGPGLIGGLLAGVAFAKGLAAGAGKPFLGVNHLVGHALTARMTHGVAFPYLTLLASGGHCQFLAVRSADSFLRLGGTIDDAPGEAFDKSARLIGLDQPGGPAIEQCARCGNPNRFALPRPLSGRKGCSMSFSGLKTALLQAHTKIQAEGDPTDSDISDLAAGFQQAIVDIFVEKSCAALEMYHQEMGEKPNVFAFCGGVAANQTIRQNLQTLCAHSSVEFVAPPLQYCTDNAAMIAWTGAEIYQPGQSSGFDLKARPRWPLDERNIPPLLGSGRKGPKS
ncbi:MAG: tRNA (adenosine(37)-N6)-threonylcarbamoyltransferase complex transferase subunit TsaD [Rhodobacteraceae bacterium]|nr:tRNA (adenosine(37)-N6)-threonylcarbamoyltransferase complex transferase subunit TsaD [Paracoccaceae bacterium]MCY4195655.1 tRNA (adenosine(37)-N6)-threonylcarbamoyltransferase complex transferase subunit TsaD [Paracoccaceae bacterium]MCY4326393.1 tRNA (adenosine(37)-N6)-threonylcarbamoyltransferase complex transferase subunit TsaD [Paracoccaceae bacterium]